MTRMTGHRRPGELDEPPSTILDLPDQTSQRSQSDFNTKMETAPQKLTRNNKVTRSDQPVIQPLYGDTQSHRAQTVVTVGCDQVAGVGRAWAGCSGRCRAGKASLLISLSLAASPCAR